LWNKAYQRQYHAEHRPSPTPKPQRDLDLPRYGEIIAEDDQIQCHVCGKFYKSLVTHIRTHGYNAETYKAAFDLPRRASLLSPATSAKRSAQAVERGFPGLGLPLVKTRRNRKGVDNRLGARVNVSVGHLKENNE